MTGAHAGGPRSDDAQHHHAEPHHQPHHAQSHQAQPRRPLAWRLGTPVVGLLVGGLFVVSATSSGGTDLRPGRYTDLASLVDAEAGEYEELQAEINDLNAEIDSLAEGVSSWGVARTRGQIEELSDEAGMEPRRGPGVTITMSDSPVDLIDDAIEHDIEPDRLVVHQQDLQAVVNALWTGGATAVTIAGQRVVTTTGIKCEGNAVQLHGVPYPQPYVIEAVGDQSDLVEAVEADPIVAGYRTDAANPLIDIGWAMALDDEVEAPAYDGLLDLRYAEPLR